jgi:copper chaperone CopZ
MMMKPLLSLTVLLIALSACSQDAASPAEVTSAAAPAAPAATETITATETAAPTETVSAAVPELPVAAGQSSLRLAIEGMHCEGCAAGVAKRLQGVSGVADCVVSMEAGQAVVVYDPAATDAASLAAAAIAGTDYAVSPLP